MPPGPLGPHKNSKKKTENPGNPGKSRKSWKSEYIELPIYRPLKAAAMLPGVAYNQQLLLQVARVTRLMHRNIHREYPQGISGLGATLQPAAKVTLVFEYHIYHIYHIFHMFHISYIFHIFHIFHKNTNQ